MLEFNEITKKQNKNIIIDHLSMQFGKNGFAGIIGSQKEIESIFSMICHLDTKYSGQIKFYNKNIKKMNEQELNYYHSIVGSVVMNMQLPSKITIYAALNIVLDIYNQDMDKQSIDKVLQIVELEGMGNKKISSLPVNLRRRVLLAQAIIKKPDFLIVLDNYMEEDTEFYKILERLSKQKLVILLVCKAKEYLKQCDHIIALKDGSVAKEGKKTEIPLEKETFSNKKKILPRKRKVQLRKTYFQHKVTPIFLNTFFLTITFILIGFMFFIPNINLQKENMNKILQEKQGLLRFQKTNKNTSDSNIRQSFSDEEIESLQEKLNQKLVKSYTIQKENQPIQLSLNQKETSPYYKPIIQLEFINIGNVNLFSESTIIGRRPTKQNEILIHKYLADQIIHFGIQTEEEIYQPSDYEQIIHDQKEIDLYYLKVKIVGIIEDDLTKYDPLKIKTDTNTYLELEEYANYYGNKIYVTNTFITYVLSKESENHKTGNLNIEIKQGEGTDILLGTASTIQQEVEVYTENGIEKISSLNSDQIVLDSSYLEIMSNYQFKRDLESYKREHPDLEEKEATSNFTIQYIKDQKLLQNLVTINVTDKETNLQKTYSNMKIVGFIENSSSLIYFYRDKIKDYILPNMKIQSLYMSTLEKDTLQPIFQEYFTEKEGIIVQNIYSSMLSNIAYTLDLLKYIVFALGSFFLIISIGILVCYIVSHIRKHTREIKLLRIIGVEEYHIASMFQYPIYIIATISLLLSLILIPLITQLVCGYFMFDFKIGFQLRPTCMLLVEGILLTSLVLIFTKLMIHKKRINKKNIV